MQNLTRAHEELYRRRPDERFASLDGLWQHCQGEKERSIEQWHAPALVTPCRWRSRSATGGGAKVQHPMT